MRKDPQLASHKTHFLWHLFPPPHIISCPTKTSSCSLSPLFSSVRPLQKKCSFIVGTLVLSPLFCVGTHLSLSRKGLHSISSKLDKPPQGTSNLISNPLPRSPWLWKTNKQKAINGWMCVCWKTSFTLHLKIVKNCSWYFSFLMWSVNNVGLWRSECPGEQWVGYLAHKRKKEARTIEMLNNTQRWHTHTQREVEKWVKHDGRLKQWSAERRTRNGGCRPGKGDASVLLCLKTNK